METSNQNTQPTAKQLASGLVITPTEARKILGDEASKLSSDALVMLIISFTEIAHQVLLLTGDGGQYNG